MPDGAIKESIQLDMDDIFLGVMVIIHISMMLGIFHMNVHTSAVAMW